MSATTDQELAELRRANLELLRERDVLRAENEELRAAQAAGLEVLQAMIASPGNTQPVFDLIARQAAKLCDVPHGVVARFDGELIHLVTHIGMDPAVAEVLVRQFPRPPGQDIAMGRAILTGQIEQIEDIAADPHRPFVAPPGQGSVLAVPLLRDGTPLGVIAIARHARGPFSKNQTTLLQTFAEQSVIAISSAETYRALQTRTDDLQESLEYQTATSDVLKAISSSDFELEPVFQAVVETATRLCRADQAVIYRYHGGFYRWAAGTSLLPDYEEIERGVRVAPGTGTLVGRVALERRPIEIPDALADPLYEVKDDARVGGIRTLLGVPLMRDETPIGVIGLARQRIEAFTERQIELVKTFADQAVIAIENARLITEQREALEQQTATAEVLQVITHQSVI